MSRKNREAKVSPPVLSPADAKLASVRSSPFASEEAKETVPAAEGATGDATALLPGETLRERNARLTLAVRTGQGGEFGVPNGNRDGRPLRGALDETGRRVVNVYATFASVVRDLTESGAVAVSEAEVVSEAETRIRLVDPTYSATLGRFRTFLLEVRNRSRGGKDSGKGPYGGVVYGPNGENGKVRLTYVSDSRSAYDYSRGEANGGPATRRPAGK